MKKSNSEILKIDLLRIGYAAGKRVELLMPPLSASARKGELIAVIGRNGIGKSTLLRTIIGLQNSLGGKVILNNKNISEISANELARESGYISTDIVRVSNMKVYDLVALGRFPHTNWIGKLDQESLIAIRNALIKTGMESFSDRYVSELSDGERQRAMISRVLAQDTEIMVMDEPTAFLDIAGKYEIINLMLNLTREGKTIIFSTHDFNIALNQTDKIWLLTENYLLEGAPEDLMLKGAFDHLFESSVVGFNSEDGSFSFRNQSRGIIWVEGEGMLRNWSEKAVIRAGYSISEIKSAPYIRIPGKTNKKWELVMDDLSKEFNSLYDLVASLRQINDG
ncbi:MAG: ABC transporter ATP-binding protein [Bacteroidales bacterium]|jgi:iron complex transport system ATP-binding protein|nr:ABC transporter ATP-binding protein [Bacteroidales bacterium]